jgi:Ca2+-binding EF-hand superfamily protein
MRRFDLNNDGKVTRDEVNESVKRMFARFDLNGDGRITDDDLPPIMRGQNALKGDGVAGMGMRPGAFMMRRLIAADANKDGTITLEEAQAAAMRRFDQFDRNKDGAIDQADIDQLRKEMTDYRVQRFLHRYGADKDGRVTREQFMAEAADAFKRLDANSDGRVDRGDWQGRRGPGRGR